jgi:mRNA-degrading endonuclease toxin of MazEF toxin-antitoxin module
MQKDFDSWNEVKKKTDTEVSRLYTVREMWWCRLGINVGTEQDGSPDNFVRPVLIIRGLGPNACLVVPLTTSKREHSLRVPIGLVENREARANISQLRVIDTRRLGEKIGFLDKEHFAYIRKTARTLF